MNFLKRLMLVTSAALTLVSCGGGGGSAGDTQLSYAISMRAAKTQLPINIASVGPDTGAYASWTTTVYVEAREGGAFIQDGKEVFACNVTQGLDSGVLYYLDGKAEHEKTVVDANGNSTTIPLAYRNIVLDSNSGSASFHLHAQNQAGTVRVTCSITNPRDKQVSTTSVDVVVGAATGKAANIRGAVEAPKYLFSRDALNRGVKPEPPYNGNNIGIQAFVRDDANQYIPDPKAANVQVSILPYGDAANGARLLSGSQSGTVVQVKTIGGIALASLSSGEKVGTIILQFVVDRYDNDVTNGIQDPITSLWPVSVVAGVATSPLNFSEVTISVPNSKPYIHGLTADGGVPPYTWSYTGNLPNGLAISSEGLITGTPKDQPGDYGIRLTVTDANGTKVTKDVTITLVGGLIEPLVFNINGCTGDVNTPCAIPAATLGASYAYAFSATGGDSSAGYTWSYNGLPTWLTSGVAGSSGVITSAAVTGSAGTKFFFVTVKSGTQSQTRQISLTVN